MKREDKGAHQKGWLEELDFFPQRELMVDVLQSGRNSMIEVMGGELLLVQVKMHLFLLLHAKVPNSHAEKWRSSPERTTQVLLGFLSIQFLLGI